VRRWRAGARIYDALLLRGDIPDTIDSIRTLEFKERAPNQVDLEKVYNQLNLHHALRTFFRRAPGSILGAACASQKISLVSSQTIQLDIDNERVSESSPTCLFSVSRKPSSYLVVGGFSKARLKRNVFPIKRNLPDIDFGT
jgi:hypothetical protein